MNGRAWVAFCLIVGTLSVTPAEASGRKNEQDARPGSRTFPAAETIRLKTAPSSARVAYGADFEGYVATLSLTDALNVGFQYKRSGRRFVSGFFTELGIDLMDLGLLYAAGHRSEDRSLAAVSTLVHGFHESYYENVFSSDPEIRRRPLTSRFVLPVGMFRMEFVRGSKPALYLPLENLFVASYLVILRSEYGSADLDWNNSLLSGSWVFASRRAIVDEEGQQIHGSNFYPAPVSVYRAGTKEESETILHEAFVHVRQGDWSRRVFRAMTYRPDPDSPGYERALGTRDWLVAGPVRFGAKLDKTALYSVMFGRLTAGLFDDAREEMAYGFTDDCRDADLNRVPCH